MKYYKVGDRVRAVQRIVEGGDVEGDVRATFPSPAYIHAEKGDVGEITHLEHEMDRIVVRFHNKRCCDQTIGTVCLRSEIEPLSLDGPDNMKKRRSLEEYGKEHFSEEFLSAAAKAYAEIEAEAHHKCSSNAIDSEVVELFDGITSGTFKNIALLSCSVNGEQSAAIVIVNRTENNSYDVCPVFVAITPTMSITDPDGHEM